MKHIRLTCFYSLFLSFVLLISSLPLAAMIESAVQNITTAQNRINNEEQYVYLQKEPHNIAHFINDISQLDDDIESPVHQLKHYIQDGFTIGLRDEILAVFEYTDQLLKQYHDTIKNKKCNDLLTTLDHLEIAIIDGLLTVDSHNDIHKSKYPLWIINKRMRVKGKSKFESEFIVKGKARLHDRARFYKNAHFKNNIKVDGVASLQDAVIENLTLTGGLDVTDLTLDSLTATDIVVENLQVNGCVSNLCVDTVSMTNATVDNLTLTGELDVTDLTLDSLTATDIVVENLQVNGCMSNLCVDTVSMTNATVDNLTLTGGLDVTDLTLDSLTATDIVVENLQVNGCVSNLCVENISVTDAVVSNTFSANDAAIQYLDIVHSNRFLDSSNTHYVGITAPTSVPSSYSVKLPSVSPLSNQVLRTNGIDPTQLEWATEGGFVSPAASKTIYVAKYGNDTTGDGSFNNPYLTLSKAINVANSLASFVNPIAISISSGVYVENNTAGALAITAQGIAIAGESNATVIIKPLVPVNTLLSATVPVRISDITLTSSSALGIGLALSAGIFSSFTNLRITNFQTGVSCSGTSANTYGFTSCLFMNNGTAIAINDVRVQLNVCSIFGTNSSSLIAHNGITVTGGQAGVLINSGVVSLCQTGCSITNNAITTINAVSFKLNHFDIVQNGGSRTAVIGGSFELTNDPSDIDVQVSGAGTFAELIACQFNGADQSGIAQGLGLLVQDNAKVILSAGSMDSYDIGLRVGDNTDTSSTQLFASSFVINHCTTDVVQEGLSTLHFDASTASDSKIVINDSTNVKLAFFDLDSNGLAIGSSADIDTLLIQAKISSDSTQGIDINYKSSLYDHQSIGIENPVSNPTSLHVISKNNASVATITRDRADTSTVRLMSDTGSPVGGTSALRGWDIYKNNSTAELIFEYQNNDPILLSTIPAYAVMQLDGSNNQVQLPTDSTHIVFSGDTNLYRSSANVLKTDDNFIVGTLIPDKVVITNNVTNQLASSNTNSTELSFLSGVTSSIQTQLNNKVSKSGDTMTGALQLPAGAPATPSLVFTGSTTTGFSAAAGDLSLNTNGLERMKISSSGTISIDSFTLAGVVHNDGSGNLSSSLIVNSDIAPAAGIIDTKLATISTVGKVANSATTATSTNNLNTIVLRDASGNFSAGTITADLNGNATSANNFSGILSGDVTGTQSATVVSFVGGQTAANVAAATVLANGATSVNAANTIVRRDASGDLSAGTITANVIGSASNNVLKSGDTMTGALQMANQSEVQFQDAAGGQYVGVNAPAVVPTSYTLSLPADAPATGQTLRSGATVPTDLEWSTEGGSIVPAVSRIIYVAKYGNDVTGNGSFDLPYASLSKALDTANSLSVVVDPVAIAMAPGVYVEDNSAGPLAVSSEGISIIGDSPTSVIIMPSTLSNDLLLINQSIVIARVGFVAGGPSTAMGLSLTAGSLSEFINIRVVGFQVGAMCTGTPLDNYAFDNCCFVDNITGLYISGTVAECYNCTVLGSSNLISPSNTGLYVTGAGAVVNINGGVYGICNTGIDVNNGAVIDANGVNFEFTTFDIIESTGAQMNLSGCSFQYTSNPIDIDVQISGVGTRATISGCKFNGKDSFGIPGGLGILVSDDADVSIIGSLFSGYDIAIHIGLPSDTASTLLKVSSISIDSCTTDVLQEGASTLQFNTSTASSAKITINDSTNVGLSYFDLDDNSSLVIGSNADQDTILLQAAIDQSNHPGIDYRSSLYSTQAIGYDNPFGQPSSLYIVANDDAHVTAVTTLNSDSAGVRLMSDTGSPVGGTTALRGWDINKNGSTAELSFSYQNSDLAGQSLIAPYTVMQLDGVNNQLQLPTAATKIVFAGDTNLYRMAANVLKTEDDFIVGTLTPQRAVITNASNYLASSVVTDTELSFLSGVTSSVQTQLNNKVSKSGDTMTGALQLPAGTTTAPSLIFTGSSTTGLSASSNDLSLSTNALERMKISSGGTVSINAFSSAGVVHNDTSGNLSSSLIVNNDITDGTIANAKLATISSSNTAGAIVVRDGSGNFQTNQITILGAVTNSTDAATKAYVDAATSTGLIVKIPAFIASITNITINGLQTIDGVSVSANDRILLVGQTNPVENGLWLAQVGVWTRPADFANGTTAGESYVLVTSGSTYAGASWVCNTPTAIIGTDPLLFEQFSLPDTTTGANVGLGTGLIFKNKTGVTLNFRSLLAGPHVTFTTNTDDITATTDATNTNTVSTIVSRDSFGNFSAGTITANVIGNASDNVLKTGDTMTGTLTVPAGTTSVPSLTFTGSTTSGLSANSDTVSISTGGIERMKIDSFGVVAIDNLASTGVVHNDSSGNLSSSLIVNTDVSPSAAIVDTKLATISTAGKVANTATTATSANTANAIVSRDSSGNFIASTITATLNGSASNNVLKAGDTMTGALQLPAGAPATPSLVFTGSTTAGLSASAGDMSFNTNGTERMKIASSGVISIDSFTAAGVVHNDFFGNLSSSLIVNADVSPAAAIIDTKLATISTAGKVANSATTATSANTASAIVLRDSLGDFSAGTITANLTGNATTSINFTGSLAGDVTGTQSATVVNSVGGQSAANVASATTAANAATSSNTPNTIVKRDVSGNFSAGTITANLTGNASGNVLKTGDTMTGALVMATQNQVKFQDSFGSNYVGINAPSSVSSSYTLSLPSDSPSVGQTLRAGSVTSTNLEWITEGGSITPPISRIVYVTKYGNDITGDGSFDKPYASLAKAVDIANSLATISDPVSIFINAGVYVEDNSMGPIIVSSEAIAIVGDSSSSVIIMPSTLSNDLLLINESISIIQMGFVAEGVSTATALSFTSGPFTQCSNISVTGFQVGVECSGGAFDNYAFNNCFFVENGTGFINNGTVTESYNCTYVGSASMITPQNTAIKITGTGAISVIDGGVCGVCETGLDVSNNAMVTASSILFELNNFDVVQMSGSQLALSGCNFQLTISPADIDIQISGAGTVSQITNCNLNGKDALGNAQGTGIAVSDSASVQIIGGCINYFDTAIQAGISSDTSSTNVFASSSSISNCNTDLLQQGSSTLYFNGGVTTSTKISINDATNVTFAFFDLDDNSALSIGSTTDVDTKLLQVEMNPANHISLDYKSSLYSSQAIGINNPLSNPSSLFVASNNNVSVDAITTDRTKSAGVHLFSDTAPSYGGTTSLRGWSINKNGSAAQLSFAYQNNDLVGQSLIPQYTVMQLDGVNNQLQLPTTATQIVFSGDTNLYRNAADVLKTDDNFIVGTLTPQRVVITNASNFLASSVVTDTELSFLSGVTSSVQTQLNNKVSRSGDTMTGTLQLPAGTTAAPSLTFTGSTTTGLSASSSNLSFSTNALERMKISSGGTVSINGFTLAGVVHNDTSGNLSSSLIVNADVSASAAIVDTKLATISTAGKVANSATTATSANTSNAIVTRDASGNFSAGTITANLSGNATTATTATNFSGSLSGDVTGTQGATVVSSVGGQTAASVASTVTTVNAATNLNAASTLVKRDGTGSFAAQTISLVDEVATGSITVIPFNTAGVIHNNTSGLLSSSLIVNADVSASAAIVDTKLATISTAGKVANSATTATDANTASAIVARDASGNFSAGTITANLNGNATTATTATNFSGSLSGDVTGTQGATVVSSVGGQTAANVASSVTTVNAATNLNTASTLVKRDGTGSFAAQTISLVDEVVSGNISLADSTSATVGNINKAGTSFIHNFGTNNTFVGKSAGNFTMTGTGNNTGVGASALVANTTGNNNTAVGRNALTTNTTGVQNTAVGSGSLATCATVTNNTAVGYNALNVTTVGSNTAVGASALAVNTTGVNTAVGASALAANTTGTSNTAVGQSALAVSTIGIQNTAVGTSALTANTTGNNNTAIGRNALTANTTGVSNTAVGSTAGAAVTTGTNNVMIGASVAATTSTGSNNIYIDGTGLNPGNESNTIRIGNAQTACFIKGIHGSTSLGGIAVRVNGFGQLGTTTSSRKFKHNIADMLNQSASIFDLRPVTFVYNSDITETMQYGLIAEEVEEVFPQLVAYDEDGTPCTVRYEVLPVLLLNEMKKQKEINEQHDLIIRKLVERVERLEACS